MNRRRWIRDEVRDWCDVLGIGFGQDAITYVSLRLVRVNQPTSEQVRDILCGIMEIEEG